ncbi:hydrogenase maturation protein HypF [Clostridium punense]|uniref:Carbamoyltransferase n=1 Tax=Clostridium punense TaxID=1054297 RepID=A0ABS4K4Z8_9CLOT|nr:MULTISPECIES: carbamoyltransferase HypF [Clostridium]EQB87842.1 hypothetical protein M918_07290 [Clostridium sp. BL8]MBP2022335.1 hydrogenase maturation protein HypF [Clostridium punense]
MLFRYVVKIYGIVQGVGFRPYVYNLAIKNNLRGWVSNDGSSLIFDVEGKRRNIKNFLTEVAKNPPPMSRIRNITSVRESVVNYRDFTIRKSSNKGETGKKYLLSDIAICGDCIKEIKDKKSIWYEYPFTSCTNCGPRYSIINNIPYDRETTNMDVFEMCKECRDKYESPENRRFHAQTISCPHCGPVLTLIDNRGEVIKCDNELEYVRALIKAGNIIAIKGIGGFHLCCDGFNAIAVDNLRKRKNRPDKPLALMMRDMETIKRYVQVSVKDEEVLKSPAAPIVLLKIKENKSLRPIAENVAPKMNYLGIMLPYTPLHHLIFGEELQALVMTSGNLSGGTVEYDNESAFKKLGQVADYFLINDRAINMPIDDSVTKVVNNKLIISRMGRGYAPYYIDLSAKGNILATGSEMKNTFALSVDGIALMSQYGGDLKNLEVYKEYVHNIDHLKKLLNYKPSYIVLDKHPDFAVRDYIKESCLKEIEVQHHFAHMVSAMVEHNINQKVIGVIYDGVGYGEDGNLWGGEFLIGDRKSFKRVGQYSYIKIQGGDSSTKNIYKIALSFLTKINNESIRDYAVKEIKKHLEKILSKREAEIYVSNHYRALDKAINCYETSSVGRIFDAVASLLGVRQDISYDGQGAIELEALVVEGIEAGYRYEISNDDWYRKVDIIPTFEDIIIDIQREIPSAEISTKFHNTLVNITVDMVNRIREKSGLDAVVLSGGVFENRYLLQKVSYGLEEDGFKVWFNEKVPINDGGISVGQLAVAKEILEG